MGDIEQANAIQEFDSISADNVPDWVFASTEPLVLRGLVKEWPLVKLAKQSPSSLIERLQSVYIGESAPVYFGDNPEVRRLSYNEDMSGLNFDVRKSDLSELLKDLLHGLYNSHERLPVRYIASNVIDHYFPGIRDDNDLNFDANHFEKNPLEGSDPLVGIWVGNQTTSPCHYDAQNNIACCVAGRRQFSLFPPSQIENLYPGPLHLNPGGQAITMVNFESPDFERYPKFAQALKFRQQAILEPGDAIFIPVMWWHEVASLCKVNVLINYWWNSFPKIQGQAMAALEHALLSIRDRSPEEKQAWKAIFDYYIFADSQSATEHLPEHLHGPLAKLDDASARRLRSQVLAKLNR